MVDTKAKPAPRVRIKKVAGHGGGHHGGSWKVAYADFVTAMMALFLVLWLVSQGDQRLKTAIANYFRAPGTFDTTRGNIMTGAAGSDGKMSTLMATKDDQTALYSTAELLKKKLTSLGSGNDQIKIDITDDGLHIQILDKADAASFAMGSADLTPKTRDILKEIAESISSLPNAIQIGGHTDAYTFPGSGYTNWELSADRANAARRELLNNGISSERIQRIVGYADTKPLVPNNLYAPANRRISIILLWQKAAAAAEKSGRERVE